MMTSAVEPRILFERELAATLDATYPTRTAALRAAIQVESYEGPITIHATPDGACTLETHDCDPGGGYDVTITVDADGTMIDVDFAGQFPDDHVLCNVTDCDHWDRLAPVRGFLDGLSDAVTISSAMPTGLVDTGDPDDDGFVDLGNWVVLTADRHRN